MTKNAIEQILERKGYINSEKLGCDKVPSNKNIISTCFGTSNVYLAISLGFKSKSVTFDGVWPYALSAQVRHTFYSYDNHRWESGIYYEVPTYEVPMRKSMEYYDQLLIQEAKQIPSCKRLKLQKIYTH